MKMYYCRYILAVLCSALLTGCIADEAPNAEADIVGATLSDSSALNRAPIIENTQVTFYVNFDVNLMELAPEFTLTEGATIVPPNGTVFDFSENKVQTYTVTSQDGKWSKEYSVTARYPNLKNNKYSFDSVVQEQSGKMPPYDVFFDAVGTDKLFWASGNSGYAIAAALMSPPISSASDYPTYQSDEGWSGKCAALTTRVTGKYGAMLGSPIAAGNLFLGTFAVNLSNTLLSTHFGIPFTQLPTYISGYYKYKPGPVYYVKDKSESDGMREVPDMIDTPSLYGVFYETTDEVQYLTGENVLAADNELIMATAILPDAEKTPTDEWCPFYIPFTYRDGVEIDYKKLAAGKYSIAIVFSSSVDGDHFSGAPGSTLMVDEVTLGSVNPDEQK